MTGNRDLATLACGRADAAPPGSLDRRAYGSVYVALATTRTLTAARQVLARVHPSEVATAALARLRELEQDGSA